MPHIPKSTQLNSWRSSGPKKVPDDHFIWYTDELQMLGAPEWPPSIFSYWGHPIPVPNVSIKYVGRGSTFLKCLVTFKKRQLDAKSGLLVETKHYTVPAWQGDNNLIHLMEELPGETEKNLNMVAFYESDTEIDLDYLQRLRRFYTEEELWEKAPEVFFHTNVIGGLND